MTQCRLLYDGQHRPLRSIRERGPPTLQRTRSHLDEAANKHHCLWHVGSFRSIWTESRRARDCNPAGQKESSGTWSYRVTREAINVDRRPKATSSDQNSKTTSSDQKSETTSSDQKSETTSSDQESETTCCEFNSNAAEKKIG